MSFNHPWYDNGEEQASDEGLRDERGELSSVLGEEGRRGNIHPTRRQ